MVEPIDATRPGRATHRPLADALVALAVAGCLSGCGLVPRSKLDECHRVSQTLRGENNRLKDVSLELRAENEDLTQRAVDDARRLAAQEDAVGRLERSVVAYQSERDAMAAAFEAVKRQVRMAVTPHASGRPARLKSFASSHPGWTFDEAGMTLWAASDRLFAPGTDRLRPEADGALKALASELSGDGADGLSLEVVGPAPAPPVVRAGFDSGAEAPGVAAASGRFLGAARAARVRDRLVTGAGLDPARARLAPTPPDDPSRADARRVEIRLNCRPADTPGRTGEGAPAGP